MERGVFLLGEGWRRDEAMFEGLGGTIKSGYWQQRKLKLGLAADCGRGTGCDEHIYTNATTWLTATRGGDLSACDGVVRERRKERTGGRNGRNGGNCGGGGLRWQMIWKTFEKFKKTAVFEIARLWYTSLLPMLPANHCKQIFSRMHASRFQTPPRPFVHAARAARTNARVEFTPGRAWSIYCPCKSGTVLYCTCWTSLYEETWVQSSTVDRR